MDGCYGQRMSRFCRPPRRLRVAPISGATCGTVVRMAEKRRPGAGRPSLGERMRVPVRMSPEVYEALRHEAQTRGSSMSQLLADLAAVHLGMPEAALKLDGLEKLSA